MGGSRIYFGGRSETAVGKGILHGEGAPSDTLGRDDEFYIDTLNIDIYGPKQNGTWGIGPIEILGPQGPVGKSAYDLAVQVGFVGTLEDWLVALDGTDGTDGFSAYEIALNSGFVGTEGQWMASLRPSGEEIFEDAKQDIITIIDSFVEQAVALIPPPQNGVDGLNGSDGVDGLNGSDGIDGVDGQSAYELAVSLGFIGTESEWIDSLSALDGESAYEVAVNNGFIGTVEDWLLSLNGSDGLDGSNGTNGLDGADGQDGIDGSTILSGTIAPTTEGLDGDFYIDTAAWFIYGPKAAGVWPVGISIVGPEGVAGSSQSSSVLFGKDKFYFNPASPTYQLPSIPLANSSLIHVKDGSILDEGVDYTIDVNGLITFDVLAEAVLNLTTDDQVIAKYSYIEIPVIP